ncbi:MAG: hypothetical protein R2780_06225 [Crocinitomicaceae bacterium]|nr:hypothetical protein [Crocinitomicaceae bacterium]
MKAIEIKKKELKKIKFPSKDVLDSPKKRRFRSLKLRSAMQDKSPNNRYQLIVKSKERGLFAITSRILVAENNYTILHGGHVIPTKSIIKIK